MVAVSSPVLVLSDVLIQDRKAQAEQKWHLKQQLCWATEQRRDILRNMPVHSGVFFICLVRRASLSSLPGWQPHSLISFSFFSTRV